MTNLTRVLIPLSILLMLSACSGAASATLPPNRVPVEPSAPAAAPAASAAASSALVEGGTVATPDEAVARVIALDPRFAGLTAKSTDVIGACCFYEVRPNADGFQVIVELGWGDCQAGCINRHRWTYVVAGDGTTTLKSETGDPVPSSFPPAGKGDY